MEGFGTAGFPLIVSLLPVTLSVIECNNSSLQSQSGETNTCWLQNKGTEAAQPSHLLSIIPHNGTATAGDPEQHALQLEGYWNEKCTTH